MIRASCSGSIAPLLAFLACGCGGASEPPAHPHVRGAQPVLATSADEQGPAAGAGAFAWMQAHGGNRLPPRTRADVFLRVGGRTVRVNPPRSYAQTGGFDRGGLVLQVIASGRSRLARYDLATRRLSALPPWVNDGAWLWRPDADGGRILYGAIVPGRAAPLTYEIRLADLQRRSVRVLARLDGHAEYAAPGQLRGAWATWVACPESTCDVWREDLRTGVAESAPDPDHLTHTQIAPAVDRAGVVWFDRTLASCGHAEIRRWDGHGVTTIVRLPARSAYQYGYVAKDGRTLYIDLGACSNAIGNDIYSLPAR
jgi:hypothetical protein